MTISVIAPLAYQNFAVRSGTNYTSNANKLISSVAVGDVVDLLNSGCSTPVGTLNNDTATTVPGVGDDSADGYSVGSRWINNATGVIYFCTDATLGAAVWGVAGEGGLTAAEIAFLDGALAQTVVNSKAAIYGTAGRLAHGSASPAAAGANQAAATALTAQVNSVTGADGAKGVALPACAADELVVVQNTDASNVLKVYPIASGNDQINAEAANASVSVGPGRTAVFVGRSGTQWYVDANALVAATPAALALVVQGLAAGYKVARGVHTQIAASDTVATGLATVVAAVAQFQSLPTVKQLFCAADVGNQAGAPAAGSILIKTLKPTAVNDVTPTAATDFTDNLAIAWVAIGT